MPKLTNYQRDRARAAMLRDAFAARQAALEKREQALATKVLLARYGVDAFERFAAVPEGWLPATDKFLVEYDGGSTRRWLQLPESRPMPAELYQGGAWELPAKLGRELIALEAARREILAEKQQLDRDLRHALYGFATEAALRDGWPEAYAHLAPPAGQTPNLPAVRVEDLNRRIAALKEAA